MRNRLKSTTEIHSKHQKQHSHPQQLSEPAANEFEFLSNLIGMTSGHQNTSPRHLTARGDQKYGFIGRSPVPLLNVYSNSNNCKVNKISNNVSINSHYYSNSGLITQSNINSNGSGSSSSMHSINLKKKSQQSLQHKSHASPDFWMWYAYAFIGCTAIVCYVNGIDGDFVHDDIPAITLNKDVLGTNQITSTFFNDFWGTPMEDAASHKSYRPLTVLTFRWAICILKKFSAHSWCSYQVSTWYLYDNFTLCGCMFTRRSGIPVCRYRLNYYLFGMEPIWFHLTNIVLHAIVCVLFTRVCIIVAGLQDNFAVLAGILFAVHPIHTEAVSYNDLICFNHSLRNKIHTNIRQFFFWSTGDWNCGASRHFSLYIFFNITSCVS